MVKKAADKLGIAVTAASVPDEGTEITLDLNTRRLELE